MKKKKRKKTIEAAEQPKSSIIGAQATRGNCCGGQ